MTQTTAAAQTKTALSTGELTAQIELALSKSRKTQRPFFLVLIQVENLAAYRRRKSVEAGNRLLREMHTAVRRAVHASQHVGVVSDGVAILFDAAEPGQVDLISRRLTALCQNVIRDGAHNDLSTNWTDVLYQFLIPGGGGAMTAKAGWSIYPRDGDGANEILKRAWAHLQQSR